MAEEQKAVQASDPERARIERLSREIAGAARKAIRLQDAAELRSAPPAHRAASDAAVEALFTLVDGALARGEDEALSLALRLDEPDDPRPVELLDGVVQRACTELLFELDESPGEPWGARLFVVPVLLDASEPFDSRLDGTPGATALLDAFRRAANLPPDARVALSGQLHTLEQLNGLSASTTRRVTDRLAASARGTASAGKLDELPDAPAADDAETQLLFLLGAVVSRAFERPPEEELVEQGEVDSAPEPEAYLQRQTAMQDLVAPLLRQSIGGSPDRALKVGKLQHFHDGLRAGAKASALAGFVGELQDAITEREFDPRSARAIVALYRTIGGGLELRVTAQALLDGQVMAGSIHEIPETLLPEDAQEALATACRGLQFGQVAVVEEVIEESEAGDADSPGFVTLPVDSGPPPSALH
jgi:hypothetical protein